MRFLALFFLTTFLSFANEPVFTMKVGVLENFPPYYVLDKNGKPDGFAVDVFELVVKDMDATIEYKIYKTWPELIKNFKNGNVDIIPNKGITKDRELYTYFTTPIESFDISIFIRNENANLSNVSMLDGKKIGVVKKNVGEKLVKNYKNSEVVVYEDKMPMIFALLEKKIDAFIYPSPVIRSLLHNLDIDKKVSTLGASLLTVKRAIGVSTKRPELYAMINNSLKEVLKSSSYSEVQQRWFHEESFISETSLMQLVFFTFLLFLLILFTMRFYLVKKSEKMLQETIKVRTRELEEEIEKHKKTEELLKSSEERFKVLFEKAPIAYQSLDERGCVRTVNEQWLKEMEYKDKKEVVGRWFGDFLDDKGREKFKIAFEKFKALGSIEGIEYNLRTSNGHVIHVDFSGRIHNPENDVPRSHCVFINNTEAKKQEEIMLTQSRQAAMGEMVGMIAHQWRQPLAIMGMEINTIYADMALDDLDEKRLKNTLQKVSNQISYLSETIDDFRNFFRPDKEKIETSLDKILHDALGIIGKSLENSDIKVKIDGGLPRVSKFFANELVQVFLNILNNSKDAILEKEIEGVIHIVMEEESNGFYISFEDNGGGIEQQVIDHIFEPYVSTKSKNGTGLGMYMSKTIIEKHCEGSLTCKNTPEGAKFIINLPKY